MVKRGLSRDIIEESLDYNEDVEFQNIQKLIDKKIKNMGNYFDENKKRKLWNFLVRKGYSFDTIKKAFKSLNQNIEEEK